MTWLRARLILAACLFVGWLAWLGWAVAHKGSVAIVSRSQLTAATHLLVAEVAIEAGLPQKTVTVQQVLRAPEGEAPAGTLEIERLTSALVYSPEQESMVTPTAGVYLIPVVKDAGGYRVAGYPPLPGGDPIEPDRPRIYPWSPDVQAQLRALGLLGPE